MPCLALMRHPHPTRPHSPLSRLPFLLLQFATILLLCELLGPLSTMFLSTCIPLSMLCLDIPPDTA